MDFNYNELINPKNSLYRNLYCSKGNCIVIKFYYGCQNGCFINLFFFQKINIKSWQCWPYCCWLWIWKNKSTM